MNQQELNFLKKLDEIYVEYQNLLTENPEKYSPRRLEGIKSLRGMMYKQFSGSLDVLRAATKWVIVPFEGKRVIEIYCKNRTIEYSGVDDSGYHVFSCNGLTEFTLHPQFVLSESSFLIEVAGNEELMNKLFFESKITSITITHPKSGYLNSHFDLFVGRKNNGN